MVTGMGYGGVHHIAYTIHAIHFYYLLGPQNQVSHWVNSQVFYVLWAGS